MSDSLESMDIKQVARGLHPLERKVVPHLKKEGTLSELAASASMLEVEAMRALQWLEGKECVKITSTEREFVVITDLGKQAQQKGLPEEHALDALKKKGELLVSDIPKILQDKGAVGAVVGALKKIGIPFVTDKNGRPAFKWVNIKIKSPEREGLDSAQKNKWKIAVAKGKVLLKRKGYAYLSKEKVKTYKLTSLGLKLQNVKELAKEYEERLTHEMLKSGSWKEKEFRPYNVTINVPALAGGARHPVTQAIEYIKRIWLDLGFMEMEGNHMQSAFWDLDALFVPQDHPAREMQDTFYLLTADGKAAYDSKIDPVVFKEVKAAHENGGETGSLGWRYEFSKEETEKMLLRTHTTVLSAQTLDKIKKGELKPGKYFSVNTVYRNEALDWKHLFEFHQVEGIVVGENLHLGHLKGYLREFFSKMGFSDVRIRPASFPYTSPSAEIDVFDPKKNGWIELGGSGIFRPEVTTVLTGNKELVVLAWGLGLERIIKDYYQLTDIRDLYNNDFEKLKKMPLFFR